ncbi:MAG: hypothetical protein ACTTH6_03915 [Candidatus Altimarinota bacterium]
MLVFKLANPWREKMQEKEKDALLVKKSVEYYRKDGIDPPISIFEGTLKQFLKLSEIKPYGEILARSRVNDHEASVVVERRDNGDRVILIAEEIEIGGYCSLNFRLPIRRQPFLFENKNYLTNMRFFILRAFLKWVPPDQIIILTTGCIDKFAKFPFRSQ